MRKEVPKEPEKTNNPWVESGLKAYEQQASRRKLFDQILKEAVGSEDPALAAQIGMFVVNVQSLEQSLRRMITVTYSFKSYYRNDGYSVMYSIDGIMRENDSLGNLVRILKGINIRDEHTKKQVLDDFIAKLRIFAEQRNDYIHRLLLNPGINDLKKLRTSVMEANVELLSLLQDAQEKNAILDKIFELDNLPYSFARHITSSEKYEKDTK